MSLWDKLKGAINHMLGRDVIEKVKEILLEKEINII